MYPVLFISQTEEVPGSIKIPPNIRVSGLESRGNNRFYCGGGNSAKMRVVMRSR